MPKIEVENRGTFDAPSGKKLVLAIEDGGVDILHRCGGNARCTTCRVEILEGDAGPMGEVEEKKLQDMGLIDQYRLSCQIRISGDLKVRPANTVTSTNLDAGPRPKD